MTQKVVTNDEVGTVENVKKSQKSTHPCVDPVPVV
jgi:hypothetical protein